MNNQRGRGAKKLPFWGWGAFFRTCSKPMGCCALVLTGRYLLAQESRVRPASTK